MDLKDQVEQADIRLRPHVVQTAVKQAPWLGNDVQLKLENQQHTGSFKARGALNRLLQTDQTSPSRGLVAASTGNHALAVAWAAGKTAIDDALIYAPGTITQSKKARLESMGLTVEIHGDDCMEAETQARRMAAETGRCFISPYNDPAVVAGQGTVGTELTRQVDHLDAVFVAVGGGGLISGMAAALKSRWPDIQIIGCLPTRSPAMLRCIEAGQIIDVECSPTLSDATAGGVEPGAITFELCRDHVDDWVLVDETEIMNAVSLVKQHGMSIEGAAGVAVAAYQQTRTRWTNSHVAIVICGGNTGD